MRITITPADRAELAPRLRVPLAELVAAHGFTWRPFCPRCGAYQVGGRCPRCAR
jgi:hypothetical protein